MNNCCGNCLNNSPCNKQTGHCDKGCKPGYTNVFCSESIYCKINSILRTHKIIIQVETLIKKYPKEILFVYSKQYADQDTMEVGADTSAMGIVNNGICNHIDGVCLAGCQVGYIGKHCNNCKKRINFFFKVLGFRICKTYIFDFFLF